MVNATNYDAIEGIAIVGMAGRFPNAKNIEEFWQNLRDGVESISEFTNEEVISEGIDPALLNDTNYVKASAVLENIDCFDALFFDINPKEAEVTDPQHRLFLECASEALENAGYDSTRCDSRIGVFAGASLNNYLSFNINSDQVGSAKSYQKLIGNDKDFLTTRVSYKLNLSGPSITIQTACSTSLVATTVAFQSLLNYQCDMALAGGVSIRVPQKTGYLYEPGGTLSPDGHCRAFDAKAQGTTIGNGVGVVLLKRLSDAIADGDCIYAVIKGSAINNDGSLKVGYTAPSVDGQGTVIAEAMMLAGVEPETINYIEAHGTGTTLGDPVEIAALSQVFRRSTNKKGFCAIGSVKTNIGHLDVASGVVGLIKTALALKHKLIPPSLNFEQPNPQIDFANSPFYVNTTLTEWKAGLSPRRAGVSSLGIGGTNAHVILEEAPALGASSPSRPWQLLVLSAKTDSALETATTNLVQYLKQHPDISLADVAHTLQVGRREFNHRRVLVCQDIEDAINALQVRDPQRVFTHLLEAGDRPITFMFPGQGSQYVDMGKELYQTEPIFQEQVDLCCELLQPHLGLDLRSLIYPRESESKAAAEKLQQTDITQPALFVIEYALAQLWMSWGISPQAMIGHSIGEYVAACLAGVMSLGDALGLVAARGRLMQQLPSGAMLSVPLPEEEVIALLDEKLSLAASNAPSLCVVSGTDDAIDAFHNKLQDIECRRLYTSHAFHSQMMESILEVFQNEVSQIKLHPPKIPFVSNLTGTWIAAEQATNPNYWVKHLRQTVRFSSGICTLLQEPNRILLEVGPGRTLSTFAKKHSERIGFSSLRHPKEKHLDAAFLLNTLGKLWLSGVQVDWSGFYAHERRHRLPLPTYPFERQHYWIENYRQQQQDDAKPVSLGKKPDIADWFYLPLWKQSISPASLERQKTVVQKYCILVLTNELSLSSQLVKQLRTHHQDIITVEIGSKFTKLSDTQYIIDPGESSDYDTLLRELYARENLPTKIVHLWSITSKIHTVSEVEWLEQVQEKGFYSLLFLAQALGKLNLKNEFQITVISNNMQSVTGEEILYPEKATLLGAVKVIPQEYSNIRCRSIDLVLPLEGSFQEDKLINSLLNELTTATSDLMIAYRGNNQWVQTFEPIQLNETKVETSRLREKGVYLITGGLGEIGLVLAEHLAKTVQAKLLLTGRSTIPPKDEWFQWLNTHDRHNNISKKIQKLQEIEALGAEVFVISADVANFQQMEEAIAQGELLFGKLNGVIYAAGITEEKSFSFIEQTGKINCSQQFKPKVQGVIVLEKVLQGKKLDFCLLMSSLSSVLGGIGFFGYSAVNIFLDTFVHQHNQSNPVMWTSINWDAWQLGKNSKQSQSSFATGLAEFAIKPEEGIEAFQKILNYSNFSQVVVSTGELQTRINQWIKLESLQHKEDTYKVNSLSLHPRPILGTAYVAPSSELEQKIADIWQGLLGIEQVGINDNFFNLGGHSLLATQLISLLRKDFQVELSLRKIFEAPTIAELALMIEDMILAELEKLTEDKANVDAGRK
ncbi:MAG: beta-ketoacyl synthase N-terminal-like domain-containing protein [Nostoc sp.]|uniref:type I polyketide synthase n=1 Tax=Nostoc sp. TaxID=1180 RepID=UPI002FF8446B